MTHDEAVELLPWLVNGSLDEIEHGAVKEHASSCVICRRELNELEVVQASIAALGEHTDVPEPDMRRINARIDAHLASASRGSQWLDAWRKFSTGRWQLAFAVQTAALVVVVGVLLIPREPTPEFTTLSTVESLPAGHYLRVVFDPTLPEVDLSGIIDANGLSVAAGPSNRGVVTLRFAETALASEREATLQSMQNDDRVLFAQPVEGAN